ncbi:MAG: HAMP domain-containing protein, partial [Ignavibacteria bacterium]
MPHYFNEILFAISIIAAFGLVYIVYSRAASSVPAKLYIMTLLLIIGYIISHGIHFLFIKSGDVTILDKSCHSFLLLILLSITLFALYFPTESKVNNWVKSVIFIPSLIMFWGIWDNWFLLESHSHNASFEAHYTAYYPVFIMWYAILLLFNTVVLFGKYIKLKDESHKKQIVIFIFGMIFTNIIAATFGMILPWLLGFYYLVEISPASFIAGVILFTTIGISRYDMFPVVAEKLEAFSITKKVIFTALIVVPIIIILVQIPLGRVLLGVENATMWQKYFLLSLFGGILVSTIMTFVIVKFIADPINKLKLKAREIGKGNFGQIVNYQSNDEIGQLAEAFNKMSRKLKEDVVELNKKQGHITMLMKAIEYANAGICILNGDKKIIEANQQYAKFHSLNDDIIKSKKALEIYRQILNEDDYNQIVDAFEKRTGIEREVKVKCRDGSTRILLMSLTYFNLVDSTPAFIIVEVDITELKNLERQLFESEKLAELGKMSAVMAHEIKTPLTSIKMNADILKSSLGGDGRFDNSFKIIDREVNRLNKLAKEVLQYSRQIDLNIEQVNIKEIIN